MASDATIYVVNIHRQMGKSTVGFQFCDEYARKHPGANIKFGSDTQKHVKDIIKVVQDTVLKTCPKDLRPKWNKSDGEFLYSNGSVIKMIGVDINQDRLRGTPSDLVVLDEAGFFKDLDGLVKSVVLPTFNQKPHGRLILTSTPPEYLAHDYAQIYIPQAKMNNAYWELPITQNPQFSAEQVKAFSQNYDIVDAGGKVLKPGMENDKFRREYLCEIVPDSERLIFPEWQLFKGKDERGFETHPFVVDNLPHPPEYIPLVYGDFGFKDHTGIIMGWVDFDGATVWGEENATPTLACKHEIFVNYTKPSDIGRMIKDLLPTVFPGKAMSEIMFVADAALGELIEIRDQTGITFTSANGKIKQDRDGNINRVRTRIASRGIVVDSGCQNLIMQLDKGIWKQNRSDWERTELMGHCDLLAALNYMNKGAPWHKNPYPPKKLNYANTQQSAKRVNKHNPWDNFNRRPN